jgi:hypothetical protein
MASPSSLKVGELSPLDGIASLSFPIGSVPRFGRIYFRIFFLFRSKSGSAPFSSWLFSSPFGFPHAQKLERNARNLKLLLSLIPSCSWEFSPIFLARVVSSAGVGTNCHRPTPNHLPSLLKIPPPLRPLLIPLGVNSDRGGASVG